MVHQKRKALIMKITIEEILSSKINLITLNEPFASLMLVGKGETRKNRTLIRGLVCIHSAQKSYPTEKVLSIAGPDQFQRIIKAVGKPRTQEHIISIGRLVNCREMTPEDEDYCFVEYRAPWYEINKAGKAILKCLWIYEFEDMAAIEPVKYKGSQGWSILTEEQKQLIKPI